MHTPWIIVAVTRRFSQTFPLVSACDEHNDEHNEDQEQEGGEDVA